ncbi:CBS domain-containing protein [Paenibacillus methanolicus]|uniref:CBS domain protein n=1 Tax=Paenibacillus methanolicus TaxID=582686 RepID=A0A5S5BP48_9BACL|nr:CBS domain-containing protein [Paenibacillus methanolicus]TYP68965.1 CBS domain protein [Paenibacillus methanolicus]
MNIELTARQRDIVQLVRQQAPITGDQIAEQLGISRATIRSDLSLLVMLNVLSAKPKVGYFTGDAADYETQEPSCTTLSVKEVQEKPTLLASALSVHEAVVTLFLENADTICIVDENKRFIGIVTAKDLLKLTLGNPQAGAMPVGMAMSWLPAMAALSPDESIGSAVRTMLAHGLDGAPVLTESREVAGWISKTAILRKMVETDV